MGCDGGTIPTRDELVKLKKKPEQRDKDGHRLYKWQHCAITQEPLRKPIVACELGRLYNKESIIELLLNKERINAPANTEHIEKLKDVVELQLTPNPAFDAKKLSVGDGMYNDALISPWICPITGTESVISSYPQVKVGKVLFTTDDVYALVKKKGMFVATQRTEVVAERAIKVLQKDVAEAPFYKEEDLVTISPEEEELDRMSSKMNARRALIKAAKKAAKEAKKCKTESKTEFKVPNSSSGESSNGKSSDEEPPLKKAKADEVSAFKNQKKTTDLSKIKSKPKSVQDDPNSSEVYKKLFSTHKSAQNLPKGNWVTFDPRYN
ncbi:protein RTF2 homolog [Eurytemora carolleeae]|uniref:protein RTF2 homolog n=1 Tax=Eurytemora carolleeae TaxID=1294199 RepID=UPI000C76C965|nr:protein RTF2 homolog [Eurytemora carolleeae]|eukprot:XP_023331347.1 protein RTF2 homolog [Eurytemora affinis]